MSQFRLKHNTSLEEHIQQVEESLPRFQGFSFTREHSEAAMLDSLLRGKAQSALDNAGIRVDLGSVNQDLSTRRGEVADALLRQGYISEGWAKSGVSAWERAGELLGLVDSNS